MHVVVVMEKINVKFRSDLFPPKVENTWKVGKRIYVHLLWPSCNIISPAAGRTTLPVGHAGVKCFFLRRAVEEVLCQPVADLSESLTCGVSQLIVPCGPPQDILATCCGQF